MTSKSNAACLVITEVGLGTAPEAERPTLRIAKLQLSRLLLKGSSPGHVLVGCQQGLHARRSCPSGRPVPRCWAFAAASQSKHAIMHGACCSADAGMCRVLPWRR